MSFSCRVERPSPPRTRANGFPSGPRLEYILSLFNREYMVELTYLLAANDSPQGELGSAQRQVGVDRMRRGWRAEASSDAYAVRDIGGGGLRSRR